MPKIISESYSTICNIIFYTVQLFTIAWMIIAKKMLYLPDAIFSLLFFSAILILENKNLIQFKNFIRVLLILTIFTHNLFGELLNLYDNPATMLYFDKALHLFGTFSISLFAFSVVNCVERFQLSTRFQYFIFVIILGISIGTIFELAEFALDAILKVHNQRDLLDTDLDMLFNLFGAVLAGLFAGRKKSEILKNP